MASAPPPSVAATTGDDQLLVARRASPVLQKCILTLCEHGEWTASQRKTVARLSVYLRDNQYKALDLALNVVSLLAKADGTDDASARHRRFWVAMSTALREQSKQAGGGMIAPAMRAVALYVACRNASGVLRVQDGVCVEDLFPVPRTTECPDTPDNGGAPCTKGAAADVKSVKKRRSATKAGMSPVRGSADDVKNQ